MKLKYYNYVRCLNLKNILVALTYAASVQFAAITVVAGAPTAKEPSRAYLFGLARYLAERGYVTAISPRIDSTEVEIYYKQFPVSKELGNTIDFHFTIPAWHIQGTIRKANFKIEETGDWIRNETFRASSLELLRTHVDSTWKLVRADAADIYECKRPVARLLSTEIKQRILGYLLHRPVALVELRDYRFSPLESFENCLWIYDTRAGRLFEVSANGDLDNPETTRNGLPESKCYDPRQVDMADALLNRNSLHENVVWLYGLWAALNGDWAKTNPKGSRWASPDLTDTRLGIKRKGSR